MTTLKIIDKFQGRGWGKHVDEAWQELLKFDSGLFIESDNELQFIATNGHVVVANKKEIVEITNEYIVYRGKHKENSKILYGGDVFVVQSKNEKNTFIIQGTTQGSFFLKVSMDKDIKEADIDIKRYMKKGEFNSQQLAYLATAYLKGLFPVPDKGDLYYQESSDGKCILFFELDYYNSLMEKIEKVYIEGSLAASNSEHDWNNLRHTIKYALIEKDVNKQILKPYSLEF